MKILKSIRLVNFQSHRDTLITLAGPGCLTVITGPSDSGKSAVIRALRLVFYNVPQGDGYIFNAEDKCTVSLVYEDGTIVERIRSRGGINRYHIYDSVRKQGQFYEGFGTGVPLEVQQATGIRKLEIGDQSFLLNLSEQLDGPFLGKSVSGPARAKVLGKLAGTEEIDYAGKQVGTDLYRANRMQEVLDKGIELLKADIEAFRWIYSREMRVTSAEVLLADTRAKVAEIGKLKALNEQWKGFSDKVLSLRKIVVGLQAVDKGLDLVSTAQNELTEGNALVLLRSGHFEAVIESERSKSTLIRLDPVFRYASPMVEKIVEKRANATTYTALYDQYDNSSISVWSLWKLTQRLSGIEKVVNHLQQAFTDNVQLSKIEGLYDIHERSNHSALTCRRLVQNLSGIENASNHFSEATSDKSIQISLTVLADQYEQTSRSFLIQSRSLARLLNIDVANNHLLQASEDNIQQVRIKEHLKQRVSFVQMITQSLQLLGELIEKVNGTESDYLTLMSSLGKCPTCGNDIDIQKLKEAI